MRKYNYKHFLKIFIVSSVSLILLFFFSAISIDVFYDIFLKQFFGDLYLGYNNQKGLIFIIIIAICSSAFVVWKLLQKNKKAKSKNDNKSVSYLINAYIVSLFTINFILFIIIKNLHKYDIEKQQQDKEMKVIKDFLQTRQIHDSFSKKDINSLIDTINLFDSIKLKSTH